MSHGVVLLTGTLCVVMGMHLVYDLLMGAKHSRRANALTLTTTSRP